MSKTYIVTGRDTGHPLLDLAGTLNGLNIGDTFTTTLSGSLEAKLLGAGLIAHSPVAHSITSAGTPVVRSFPFAFNTPDLLPQGAPLYVPTVGDILLDAWVEIDTAWNGTTPLLDVGRFETDDESPHSGWWGWWAGSPILLTLSDSTADATASFLDYGLLSQPHAGESTGLSDLAQFLTFFGSQNPSFAARGVPGKFVSADPIRALVSTNGRPTGADPGSTQGAAVLYLITVTPV